MSGEFKGSFTSFVTRNESRRLATGAFRYSGTYPSEARLVVELTVAAAYLVPLTLAIYELRGYVLLSTSSSGGFIAGSFLFV